MIWAFNDIKVSIFLTLRGEFGVFMCKPHIFDFTLKFDKNLKKLNSARAVNWRPVRMMAMLVSGQPVVD